jgi:8-oxo-dGTP pyrophosphatase MutT (NUDIX family)
MNRDTAFVVEAWRGMECIEFSTVARPATVVRRASHYVLDRGADRVYVRRGREAAGQWQVTGGWVGVNDPDLAAAIEASY